MSKNTGKKKSAAKPKGSANSAANPALWIAAAAVLLAAVIIIFFMAGSKNRNTGGQAEADRGGPENGRVYSGQDSAADEIYADIAIEGYGTITVALDPGAAPETVSNFVSLAESGFYDGLTFHRIIEGFMMQGGDPEGTGYGGSETTITGEFSANGHDNPLSHTRGTVSMARANDPNSASSQFFIVHEDSTFLDGNYAAFGVVTSGMEIVDQICADAEPIDDNGLIAPEAQPVIASITIRAQG